ncbi:MAG: hypothetical protein HZB70_02640 [Candidatus Berkelbacteria bacterium]|nr:MAG: hypothetical protein HZB70_02640 [Candidatus Berkelbacteria bacterium]QQG51796.1 MAG: hypothetical protein HY845_00355 [Candidatus Berkelbacteria bacterium]
MSQKSPIMIVIAFADVTGKLATTLRTDLSHGLRHDHRGVARGYCLPGNIRLVLNDSATDPDILIKHPTDDEMGRVVKRMRVRKEEVTKEKFFSIRRAFQEPVVVLIPRGNKDQLAHVATLHGEVLAAITKIARTRERVATT